MLSRFSLYDFLAVVIPGIFFLWALAIVLDLKSLREALPLTGGIAETSMIVVVGYVTGLLLQSVSQLATEKLMLKAWGGFPQQRWLLYGSTHFSREYRDELNDALSRRFSLTLESVASTEPVDVRHKRNQEIFYRCYRSVEKQSDQPATFNAQYGLFRVLLTTFAIVCIVTLYSSGAEYWARKSIPLRQLALAVASLLAGIICYYRATRRSQDFAKAVLDVFLVNNPKPLA